MKKFPIVVLLMLVIAGGFGSIALADEVESNAAERGRCNQPGVDCVFEKVEAYVAAKYGVTSLPNLAPPTANYVNASQSGKTVFVSSAGPEMLTGAGGFMKAELPTMSLATAQEAAMLSCVRGLRFLKSTVGDLDRVDHVVMVTGSVNVTPTYDDVTSGPVVGALGKSVDGCSDFLVAVFGAEQGKHARSSGGKVALPFNMATEIELIVELK
ncbi:MAG TPA: RidA family protein [Herpetosiphonaceae bacterium]|nr:RidA family protein [Herpetosiphonaceae bacterium]